MRRFIWIFAVLMWRTYSCRFRAPFSFSIDREFQIRLRRCAGSFGYSLFSCGVGTAFAFDHSDYSDYSLTGLTVTTEKGEQGREQRKVKPKKKYKQNCPDIESSKNSGYKFAAAFTNPYQTMSFTPQSTSNNMSQPSYVSSPPGRFGATAFGYQATPPPPPPPWATKLLEDMEHVKQKLQCVEKNEKTVNMINAKVTDLETQMKSLDIRVNETEKSCKFISEANESNKKELKNAKDSLSNLQKSCQDIEKDAQSLKKKNENLDAKLIEFEARSMRENLMFYGIPEGGEHENLIRRCVPIIYKWWGRGGGGRVCASHDI